VTTVLCSKTNILTDTLDSRTYGSGYPGNSERGVYNHGFPFYFWPVVWVGGNGNPNAAYLHDSEVPHDHLSHFISLTNYQITVRRPEQYK
jgi:hypothetical protein